MSTLKRMLQDQRKRLHGRGFETDKLVFASPARPRQVEQVEAELGFRLPPAFRDTLLSVSGRVEFRWNTPDDFRFPPPFRASFSGQLEWALENLPDLEVHRKGWVDQVFSNPNDPEHTLWNDKLVFCAVANGDCLAIDRSDTNHERIVYLSHELDGGHGYVMANDFSDLLSRWVPLACPGAEDWQWMPFVADGGSGIDPECENAREWRKLLGLSA